MDMGVQVKEHQESLGLLQNKLQEITLQVNQQSEAAQTKAFEEDVNSKVINKFCHNMYKLLSAIVRVRM